MWKITMEVTKQVKKEGTKTVWIEDENYTETLNREQYENCTSKETISFFRNLGGSETVTRNYTKFGYVPVKIVSTSPDKQNRTIREFSFESVDLEGVGYEIRKTLKCDYDYSDTIINRLLTQVANREIDVINKLSHVESEGNMLSVIAKDGNAFNVDLRETTLGGLC